MLILAVETTADLCSVAIRDGQGTLAERAFRHRMHLSERLIGDVDALLADAGGTLADVEGFAVGIGPGSFTGVRIGVMTIKTWAEVLGRPVCGVSAFDALAEVYAGVPDTVVVPLIRARPGSLYARFYRSVGAQMEAQGDPIMLPLPDFVARLAAEPDARYLLCGEALLRYGDELRAALQAAGVSAASGRPEPPRASLIAALATARFAAGLRDDPLALTPLYLAPPPVDPRADLTRKPDSSKENP